MFYILHHISQQLFSQSKVFFLLLKRIQNFYRYYKQLVLITGDARASEQPGLGSLHTVFLREHNHIATELANLNPHWGDEVIYQETRRIIGAMYQHIVFTEFLPRIFGWEGIQKHGLTLQNEGYYKGTKG